AMISCAPQSENQRRPSCQRGDSPIASPLNKVFTSALQSLVIAAANFSELKGFPVLEILAHQEPRKIFARKDRVRLRSGRFFNPITGANDFERAGRRVNLLFA